MAIFCVNQLEDNVNLNKISNFYSFLLTKVVKNKTCRESLTPVDHITCSLFHLKLFTTQLLKQ